MLFDCRFGGIGRILKTFLNDKLICSLTLFHSGSDQVRQTASDACTLFHLNNQTNQQVIII